MQTQLIANNNSTNAAHFICTNPNASGTSSVLLDDVYFHSSADKNSETLFNDGILGYIDTYYIGGTIISSGTSPNPSTGWTALPPTLVGTFDHWQVATINPIP